MGEYSVVITTITAEYHNPVHDDACKAVSSVQASRVRTHSWPSVSAWLSDIHSLNHAGLANLNSNVDLPPMQTLETCFHCSCFKLLDMGKVKHNIHHCLINNQEVRSEACQSTCATLQLSYLSWLTRFFTSLSRYENQDIIVLNLQRNSISGTFLWACLENWQANQLALGKTDRERWGGVGLWWQEKDKNS